MARLKRKDKCRMRSRGGKYGKPWSAHAIYTSPPAEPKQKRDIVGAAVGWLLLGVVGTVVVFGALAVALR